MKKMMFTMAAAMMFSISAFAQMGGAPQQLSPEQQKEMIQQRTDETVKQYSLNEDQAKQLLDLNTKYADKMPMGFGRMGGGRRGGQGAPGGGAPQGGFGGGAPQGGFGGGQMPQMTEEQRARMEEMRKQMTETREAYNKELEKILTPEQYKKYQEDQQNRRGRGGFGGPRGPRQQ
jgi:Spy/CpxP family protein refolding chaperone